MLQFKKGAYKLEELIDMRHIINLGIEDFKSEMLCSQRKSECSNCSCNRVCRDIDSLSNYLSRLIAQKSKLHN